MYDSRNAPTRSKKLGQKSEFQHIEVSSVTTSQQTQNKMRWWCSYGFPQIEMYHLILFYYG